MLTSLQRPANTIASKGDVFPAKPARHGLENGLMIRSGTTAWPGLNKPPAAIFPAREVGNNQARTERSGDPATVVSQNHLILFRDRKARRGSRHVQIVK